jgi:hypothetical protein
MAYGFKRFRCSQRSCSAFIIVFWTVWSANDHQHNNQDNDMFEIHTPYQRSYSTLSPERQRHVRLLAGNPGMPLTPSGS